VTLLSTTVTFFSVKLFFFKKKSHHSAWFSLVSIHSTLTFETCSQRGGEDSKDTNLISKLIESVRGR
jgi:hypothetical protein